MFVVCLGLLYMHNVPVCLQVKVFRVSAFVCILYYAYACKRLMCPLHLLMILCLCYAFVVCLGLIVVYMSKICFILLC